MTENELWVTVVMVICGTICVIAGCVTYAALHKDPKTDRMETCVISGRNWVNEDCIKAP